VIACSYSVPRPPLAFRCARDVPQPHPAVGGCRVRSSPRCARRRRSRSANPPAGNRARSCYTTLRPSSARIDPVQPAVERRWNDSRAPAGSPGDDSPVRSRPRADSSARPLTSRRADRSHRSAHPQGAAGGGEKKRSYSRTVIRVTVLHGAGGRCHAPAGPDGARCRARHGSGRLAVALALGVRTTATAAQAVSPRVRLSACGVWLAGRGLGGGEGPRSDERQACDGRRARRRELPA